MRWSEKIILYLRRSRERGARILFNKLRERFFSYFFTSNFVEANRGCLLIDRLWLLLFTNILQYRDLSARQAWYLSLNWTLCRLLCLLCFWVYVQIHRFIKYIRDITVSIVWRQRSETFIFFKGNQFSQAILFTIKDKPILYLLSLIIVMCFN